ncbi:MAG: hypothetical protein ABI383_08865 [Acidobacteriaceae bacterium]
MSVTHVSFKKLILASGLALLLAAGTTTQVMAQSATSDAAAAERKCPESKFVDCSLKGIYGFGYVGLVSHAPMIDKITQYDVFASGGMWHFHGDGTFDASDTFAVDGTSSDRQYSGTYSINPDGTGNAQFTAGGLTHHRNLVIVNDRKTIEFIQTSDQGNDGLVVGTMTKQ